MSWQDILPDCQHDACEDLLFPSFNQAICYDPSKFVFPTIQSPLYAIILSRGYSTTITLALFAQQPTFQIVSGIAINTRPASPTTVHGISQSWRTSQQRWDLMWVQWNLRHLFYIMFRLPSLYHARGIWRWAGILQLRLNSWGESGLAFCSYYIVFMASFIFTKYFYAKCKWPWYAIAMSSNAAVTFATVAAAWGNAQLAAGADPEAHAHRRECVLKYSTRLETRLYY